jgi:hypothetical protein
MILRHPAVITKNLTALRTLVIQTCQFTPAIFAILFVGFMIQLEMSGAGVVFGQVMIRAEDVSASLARKGVIMDYFPAKITTVH